MDEDEFRKWLERTIEEKLKEGNYDYTEVHIGHGEMWVEAGYYLYDEKNNQYKNSEFYVYFG